MLSARNRGEHPVLFNFNLPNGALTPDATSVTG
jgi:hypothetical protein